LAAGASRRSPAVFSPDGTVLAAGLENGGIRFWDAASGTVLRDVPRIRAWSLAWRLPRGEASGVRVARWVRPRLGRGLLAETPPAVTPPTELEPFWNALGQADGEKAFQAIQAFVDRPQETVDFLKAHLQPAAGRRAGEPVKDGCRSGSGIVRGARSGRQGAGKSRERARRPLEKTLAGTPTLETRRRVETLLQKLTPPLSTPEQLRSVRAVEALERIGTPEARCLLKCLAGGAAGDRLTQDAHAALGGWIGDRTNAARRTRHSVLLSSAAFRCGSLSLLRSFAHGVPERLLG